MTPIAGACSFTALGFKTRTTQIVTNLITLDEHGLANPRATQNKQHIAILSEGKNLRSFLIPQEEQ
jgi:hypothetical protein